VRTIAFLLVASLLLQGCGASAVSPSATPVLPAFQVTGSPATIAAFSLASVATDGATPIYPLFETPSIPTNQGNLGVALWGTKDSGGNITSVTQAEISGLGGGTGTVHVFFNATSQPVLFVDDSSSYSIAVTGENTVQPLITLCDPNGTPDVSTTLTTSGATAQAGAVATGGSCTTTAVKTTLSSIRRADGVPQTVVSSFGNIASLITAGSYVGGFAFAVGAILKFKAHKDNPTQIPIGTPIALVFIAAALLFLPSILSVSGTTTFGSSSLVAVDGLLPLYELTP